MFKEAFKSLLFVRRSLRLPPPRLLTRRRARGRSYTACNSPEEDLSEAQRGSHVTRGASVRGRHGSSPRLQRRRPARRSAEAAAESGASAGADTEQLRQGRREKRAGARSRLAEQKTGCWVTLVDIRRTKKSSISRSSGFTAFRPSALCTRSLIEPRRRKKKKNLPSKTQAGIQDSTTRISHPMTATPPELELRLLIYFSGVSASRCSETK